MIKPSLSEVQNLARMTTSTILKDIDTLQAEKDFPIYPGDIIQLRVEQLLTEVIRAFEPVISNQYKPWPISKPRPLVPTPCGTTLYPEQSPE